MVLSNSEILNALQKGYIIIEPTPEIPSFEKPGRDGEKVFHFILMSVLCLI